MEVRFKSCCCIRETIIQKELATIGIRNNRTAVMDGKSVRAVLFDTDYKRTANTVTLQTGDGATITCFTEGAKDTSTSNMESGAGICITFDPTKSKNSNIYTSIKIQDA